MRLGITYETFAKPPARQVGKFEYVDEKLAGKTDLIGELSVAGGYLYIMLRWADATKLDLPLMKDLAAYKARVMARPKVQDALRPRHSR